MRSVMRLASRVAAIVAASALCAAAAAAQTCLGYSSLDGSHVNVTGDAAFRASPSAEGASFGGQLNAQHDMWGERGFVGVQLSNNSYDAPVNRSSMRLGGLLGVEQRTRDRLEWCPQVNVMYEAGPGSSRSAWQMGAGVGIGKALSSNGTIALVPFGSAGLAHLRTDVSGAHRSQTAGVFTGGLGFRFNNGAQISPSLTFTTFDNADPVFAFGVTFPVRK